MSRPRGPELATGPPAGSIELGGPEELGVDAWARKLFEATGDTRTVVELTRGPGTRVGKTGFDAWLAAQAQTTR
jgi:hypothetical protein